jgi:acyl CoA:acetate/3-ketoacid CoA transferase alpha subunit
MWLTLVKKSIRTTVSGRALDDFQHHIEFRGPSILLGDRSQAWLREHGEMYVQERAIVADAALVYAYQSDTEGNLVYRYTARNSHPLVANNLLGGASVTLRSEKGMGGLWTS